MATRKKIATRFSRWMEKGGYKTVEDFAQEAWRHGLSLRVGTIYLWSRGQSRPDRITSKFLRETFPDIKF